MEASNDEAGVEKLRAEKACMMAKLQEQLNIELKLKAGAETMLQVSESGTKGATISRDQVEAQLAQTKSKIASIQRQIDMYKNVPDLPGTRVGGHDADGSMGRKQRSGDRRGRGDGPGLESRKSENNLLRGVTPQMVADVLARLSSGTEHPSARMEAMNTLLKISRGVESLDVFATPIYIVKSLRTCLVHQSKDMRASAFRVLRHISSNLKMLQAIVDAHLDVFVMRSLTRDQRYDVEREQSLKLIRAFVDVSGGAKLLPQSLVRMLVALSEQVDDKFRAICVETLCELAIRNMELLTLAGGTKVIFNALLDGPRELTTSLVRTVLYILDSHETRSYMRPAVELEMIISQFTDAYSRGPANEEKLVSCAKVVTLLFKSWTGLIYLCSDDKRAIRSIVESLRLPFDENRKILLEMLFDILQIDVPKWYPDFVSARSRFGHFYPMHEDLLHENVNVMPLYVDRKSLVDHYLSFVLMIFIQTGLLEVLVELLHHENKYITTRVTILVGEILELCNRLLPTATGTRIQSLPILFSIASNFQDESLRHQGTLALTYIDNLHKSKERILPQSMDDAGSNRNWQTRRSQNAIRHGRSRQVENVKIKMGMQIDDVHFRNMLTELEKVLGSKEYAKWSWDVIMEFIQGPMLNAKRLDEALKTTKVVKRLVSFYRPTNHQFSDIKKSKGSAKYIRIGCELIKTLLATPEGVRYLAENRLLPEIRECLGQLDPMHGASQTEPIFSKERMEKTLTGEYFTLLGVFTQSYEGVRLLERFRVFSLYYRLTELRSRDDLVKAVILSMDYSRDNHTRVLLSKVLTSGYKSVRLIATGHMLNILQSGTEDFSEWGTQLLVTQLYDPSMEVCEKAVAVLDLACNDRQNLEAVVNMRPSLDHLGEAGNPLLLRFLSSSVGFQYLQQLNYVEPEMDYWFEFGNNHYVIRLELALARALAPKPKQNTTGTLDTSIDNVSQDTLDAENEEMDGRAPPHFYGELARTAEGCSLLRRKGHFKIFGDIIRQKGEYPSNKHEVLQLKGVLWTVGNIGAQKTGLPFLLEEDIIRHIVDIAKNSPIITLKGTCYYVIGLIAKTPAGVELLEDLGWETVAQSHGVLEGLCIPKDESLFLHISNWQYKGSWPEYTVKSKFNLEDFDATEQEILKCIGNMSNHILANAASKTLSKIRHENSNCFQRITLYLEVLRMLSVYHYRLTARRFIHDLFDRVSFNNAAFEKLDAMGQIEAIEPRPGQNSDARLAYASNSDMASDCDRDESESANAGPNASIANKNLSGKPERVILKPQTVQKGF
ncbi:Rapamycin-insensitive companion of mTOR, N-term-domain-containing protein [Phlyctochytrium arcticum]|nr:Rapamycin-insensitive companion of mTOR, N-term-domain-containing protein [Phlyctochytrium arcticum]